MSICVGCGLKVNSESGLLEVELRPGGGLDCDPSGSDAGLFVTGATVTGSNCIDVGVEGPGKVSINGSEDNHNIVTCRSTGLFVPGAIVNGIDVPSVNPTGFPGTGTDVTFNWYSGATPISVLNDTGRTLRGFMNVRVGGLVGTITPGAWGSATIEIAADGEPLHGAGPSSQKFVRNMDSVDVWFDFNNIEDNNYWEIPAGSTGTYEANLRVYVNNGTFNFSGEVGFGFGWILVPV